jgi:hypothetical protein
MTELPRIYFDANEGTFDLGYWLVLKQSLADLHALGDELQEGLEVIIYMPDELEMGARLRFDRSQSTRNTWTDGIWVAVPVPDTIKRPDVSPG